jgi:hypothetical protein
MTDTEHNDRVWGVGGWYEHECDHNGNVQLVAHSIHYHHPHDTCCPLHGGLCDKVTA